MKLKHQFALALTVMTLLFALTVGVVSWAVWADLTPVERETLGLILDNRAGLLFLLALAIVFAFHVILQVMFRAYLSPAVRLEEGIRVVQTVNPAHRVKPAGAGEMRRLAEAVNSFADAYGKQKQDVEAKIGEANAHLEEEKNRLAALMSDLTQSVLVCNSEGRILLYNASAKQLLDQPAEGKPGIGGAYVGLGRPIFAIMDKNLIVHALDTVKHKLDQDNASPSAHFVMSQGGGQLVRAHMTPILDREKNMSGFVLTLDDITRSVEINSRRDTLLQSLTEGTRASLANIRAAIETMLEFPEMEPKHRQRLTEVIEDEAEKLSARLSQTLSEHADTLKAQWPLEDMLGADLLSAIRRRLESTLALATRFDAGASPLWLRVDSYSVVEAITLVAGRVKVDFGVTSLVLSLAPDGRFARLEMRWQGSAAAAGGLADWESELFDVAASDQPLTLHQALERHGGEAWCKADKETGAAWFCMQLPTTTPEASQRAPLRPEGWPQYYDFDLFSQPGQNPELDERDLSELTYTVFDTETTGLNPSEGDEIISIGAVRIVNGRLLRHETFEQLIDPRRPMSSASVEIHGISPEMLNGQPVIDEVLPAMHRFAEDTVLVAHNAAFDMRFLQMKEERTGVKFIQPVLDTLLLSVVANPGFEGGEHQLETIATRLGVDVIGRHTALGDALVTGEVFLKLLPLLAERGIRTLREAREAAQKTLYAKLNY